MFNVSTEKQIFESFGCTKILSDSKWTKSSRNEIMEPTASKNDSRPIFLYPVLNQADFDNPFINGHLDIITWAFEDEFYFLRIYKSSR